jgi:hypothetical protein
MDEHEQRAREVVPHLPGAAGAYRQEIEQRIAAALRAAVAAERERCAKVCEERGGPNEYCPNGCSFGALAEDIRATPLLPAQAEQRATETVRMLRCIAQMYAPDSPGGRALNHAVSAMSECCACDGHAGCAHVCAAPAQAEQRVSEDEHSVGDVWRSPGGDEWEVQRVHVRVTLAGRSLTKPGWFGGIPYDRLWTRIRRGAFVLRSEADALEATPHER